MGFFGGGHKPKAAVTAVSGIQLQSSAQGLPIPLVFGTNKIAPNLIWYDDFQAIAQQSSAGAGGKGGVGGGGGGKGGGGSVSYIYQAAFMFGLCDGPVLSIGTVFANKQVTSLSTLGYSAFLGDYSQTAWGYLSSNHPTEALNYRGTAYIANPAYQMGNSPQIPNHNVEIYARYSNSISGKVDADPSLIIAFLLTDPKSGAGFPASKLASLAVYQAYCIANGLWISPTYVQQASASSLLTEIAAATNSDFVFSGDTLSIVPYGDQSISANGYVYTAPSAPQYDLTDDDFINSDGSDPVTLDRTSNADAYNSIQLGCVDRNNQYNDAVVSAKDSAAIDVYGLREKSITMPFFADLAAARMSAQLQLQKEAKRNTYHFTIDQRYVLLDVMDIVTLTDSGLGLDREWVRIKTIDETEEGNFEITAEEYLSGNSSSPLHSFQTGTGYAANYNSAPGNANPPIVFEPPVQIAQTNGLEVDIACSGGSNWGGCDIWLSSDDATYKFAGRVTGAARQGILSAMLASGTDPDTTNTLKVNMVQSGGELLSGTLADADDFNTLCYVDGELISYQTATLTGANLYDLTYLRRGVYGSPISSHSNGTQFCRMDSGIFAYSYDKTKIGQVVYIKLLSFNIWGGGAQALSEVTPTVYTIVGPPPPSQVLNFQAKQQGNVVAFTWTKLVNDVGLLGYDIAYGSVGSSWDDKRMLTEAAKGTEMTNASVPNGTWEFSIRAHDLADQLSTIISSFTLTVENSNPLISAVEQSPDWVGVVSGFVRHPSGKLVPDNTTLANATSDYTIFDTFVVDPVSSAYYISPTVDTAYDSVVRIYETHASALGVGQSGADATLQYAIDTWLTAETDPNIFTNWTIGNENMRYLRAKMSYTGITAGNVSMLTQFLPLVDSEPAAQQSGTISIAPGGSVVTFADPFRSPPDIIVTPQGASPLYGSAAAITAIDCTIHIFNSAGTDVGGVCSYLATGS